MALPKKLTDGYRAFVGERLPREQKRLGELAETGQKPEVMVIGCCDSRVSPEVIFDADPGDLFVVRNVANVVPPYAPDGAYHGVSAALEFAVQALRVKHIVVLGHARCGGIRAFADDGSEPLSPGDFIGKWITLLEPAAIRTGGRGTHEDLSIYVERLAIAAIEVSIENLMTFPCINILSGRRKLQVHGAYFDVASGVLMVRDTVTGKFLPALGTMPRRVSQFKATGA